MNFLTQQQEVAAILGLDETQSDQATLIKRWLNISQRDIGDAAHWPFLESIDPEIIQTVVDYSTGTATVAAAGTTVTFSATIADSKTDQYIQFSGNEAWYKITAHTAATDTATISPGSQAAYTASAYVIRKFFYTLSTSVDRLRRLRISDWPYELVGKPSMWLNPWSSAADQTGNPRVHMIRGKNSSDEWEFVIWPFPDSVFNFYAEYLKKLTDLSADSDISIIPEKWHTTAMLQGALWHGWEFLDDTRANSARMQFEKYIQSMKDGLLPNLDEERILHSVDGEVMLREPLLPGTYPLR